MKKITSITKALVVLAASVTYLPSQANEAEKRIASFVKPAEFDIKVWADSSLTNNPAFFYFSDDGRMFISEIYRIFNGVGDVRYFSTEAVLDDIYIKTMDDRLAMYKRYPEFKRDLESTVSDKVRLVQDTDGDGVADKAQFFAQGFNDPMDGLASGVISRDGDVYFTNIPNLWLLQDSDGDGISDKKTVLQDGFGTRVSFYGHDLHGLAWGPDGRLYWSIGDRGFHLETKEGNTFSGPNQGAVFRANPDGSNLEVFYHGLRNPQELVFDEYGNLFTADNDGDKGDEERVSHLIEGGNSGWHAGNQNIMSFGNKLNVRSAKYTGIQNVPVKWLENQLWKVRNENQPAYLLPGIAQLFRGPSGFTYNPSTYLTDDYHKTFFINHYTGVPAQSYTSTLKLKTNGASFLPSHQGNFSSGMNASDVDFGPDGRLYMAEFNFGGWESSNQGAIYAFEANNLSDDKKALHKKYHQILVSDFTKKSVDELVELLATDHIRIRRQAQFALAKRGDESYAAFNNVASSVKQDTFARIHSIWGLSQLVFNKSIDASKLKVLLPLMADNNAHIRAQAARVLGDHGVKYAADVLTNGLTDKAPQVVMYSALGLAKVNSPAAVPSIIKALETNGDKDLWVRHALTMALKGTDKSAWFNQYKNHASKDVRMGVLLALRLLKDNDVAYFLNDKEIALSNEAIVAIDDNELVDVRGQVAALLTSDRPTGSKSQDYFHHRLINANFAEGDIASAERLLSYAARPNLKDRLAAEALAAIEGWHDLNPINTITGLPETANKQRADINATVNALLGQVLDNVKGISLVQAMRIAGQVNFQLSESALAKIANETTTGYAIRVQALDLLNKNIANKALPIANDLLKDDSKHVIAKSLEIIYQHDQSAAIDVIKRFIASDSATEVKIALQQLVNIKGALVNKEIDDLLLAHLNSMLKGAHDLSIGLEIENAAKVSNNKAIQKLYGNYEKALAAKSVNTRYKNAQLGGDIAKGKNIVFNNGSAACLRCHKIGRAGADVGPSLSFVGGKYDESYLLEALIDPSASVAPGFGNYTLTMKDGSEIQDTYQGENDTTIFLGTKWNKVEYNKADISNIVKPASGMPPMTYMLNKEEIRDVVAYLASLKKSSKAKPKGGH